MSKGQKYICSLHVLYIIMIEKVPKKRNS